MPAVLAIAGAVMAVLLKHDRRRAECCGVAHREAQDLLPMRQLVVVPHCKYVESETRVGVQKKGSSIDRVSQALFDASAHC
jgi:hypothetical protein